jgi:hypothetical protein
MQRRALLVIGAFVVGCGSGALDLRSARPYALTENSLSFNGLIANGLLSNGLRMNGLRMNGLRMNGLEVDSLSFNDLPDPAESLKVLTYLVECAALADEITTVTIGGTPTPFYGALGLAPEWNTSGIVGEDSEEKVTSCLMARTNANGQSVQIALEGDGLSQDPGEGIYKFPEAAYWGNIFMPSAQLWAYPAQVFTRSAEDEFIALGRSCMLGLEYCQFNQGDVGGAPLNAITVSDLLNLSVPGPLPPISLH